MQSLVTQVRPNIKPSYTTTFGTFFVHGVLFSGDPLEYEYHSKSENQNKIKIGSSITYSVTKDAKGNSKLKLEAPVPGAAPTVAPPVVNSDRETWLSVFRSLSIFSSNKLTVNIEDLIQATNKVIKQVP